MSHRRMLIPGAISAALASGCGSAPQASPPARAPLAAVASTPSTQPVIGTLVNDATVEFDSSWSSFRFAEQSNSTTVKLTSPATPVSPPLVTLAPTAEPPTQPTGSSDAQAGRGGETPDAFRGNASADAARGNADAVAVRGYATAVDARGTVTADSARGHYTVQVLRGGAEAVAAHHDNTSAVVRPDLSITLRADPPAAAPGDTVLYTITIKNISGIEARDITLTDYLPQQMECLSAQGAKLTPDPDDTSTHLALPGAVPPGASVQVQLLARVKPSAGRP